MASAICLLSVVPMRKEPAHRSEMVSQLLFGECVTVTDEKDGFVFVKCFYDGYEGWVQASQLTVIHDVNSFQTSYFTNGFTTMVVDGETGTQVPFGTPVYNSSQLSFSVNRKNFRYLCQPQQVWNSKEFAFSETALKAVYYPYMNTPYLWGGKSVFGIDCSGFAQQVFKFFGVRLLRDAYLQAEQGCAVNSLEETKCGDLAFFQNEKGRVTHVGIILNDETIVHAAGRVRIDRITKEGIVNTETGKQTHVFHSIRRFF